MTNQESERAWVFLLSEWFIKISPTATVWFVPFDLDVVAIMPEQTGHEEWYMPPDQVEMRRLVLEAGIEIKAGYHENSQTLIIGLEGFNP